MVQDVEAATVTQKEAAAAIKQTEQEAAKRAALDKARERFTRQEVHKTPADFKQSKSACTQGYAPNPVNLQLSLKEQCDIVNSAGMDALRKQYEETQEEKTKGILCHGEMKSCKTTHGLPAPSISEGKKR